MAQSYVNEHSVIREGHVIITQAPADVNGKPDGLGVGRYLVIDPSGKTVKTIKRDDKGKAALQAFVESLVPKPEDVLKDLLSFDDEKNDISEGETTEADLVAE